MDQKTTEVMADNIQLNHLSWETSIQKNIGFDLSMWNDRVTLVNDWYIKTTHDLLYEKNIPGSTGFERVLQNFGDIENKGFDVGAEVYVLQGLFNWNVSVNLSRNINYITQLTRGESIEGEIRTEEEIRHLERENLRTALEKTEWKIYGTGGAAELLGIKPTTLMSRIKKMGLKRHPQ